MKMLLSFMRSMKTMIVLMLIFAFSVGWATIIENDYGTATARAEIYDADWFFVLLALLTITLVLNMIRFASRKKPFVFLFHFSFLVILAGASLTHFFGYEGMMHIRTGQASSSITSTLPYVNITATNGSKQIEKSYMKYMSNQRHNSFSKAIKVGDKSLHVSLTGYIPSVMQALVPSKNGKPVASIMITLHGHGDKIQLSRGKYFESDNLILDFGSGHKFTKPVIEISDINNTLYMSHTTPLQYFKMDTRTRGELQPSTKQLFAKRTLFTYKSTNFVLRGFYPSAVTKLVTDPKAKARKPQMDAFYFKVTSGNESKTLLVYGQGGMLGDNATTSVNGITVGINYGSKIITLPFSLKLDAFHLTRYPGSMSPSSYASQVTLIDPKHDTTLPYNIHMNHILNYRGFKFFQSSYDQDLKGTILSVNRDPGTDLTYLGYLLLAIGLFGALLVPNGRFATLSKIAKSANAKKSALAVLALVAVFHQTNLHADELNPVIKTVTSFQKASADKFGDLVVQSNGQRGRMEPLNTLATEVLNKIYRSDTMFGLDANQVILGMLIRPDAWRQVKMIRTSDKEINKIIGVSPDTKYAAFSQFFRNPSTMNGYKLAPYVDKVIRMDPKTRGVYDRHILKVDERVNVAYMVYTGSMFKIWPKPNDPAQKWYDTVSALKHFSTPDAQRIRGLAMNYFSSIDKALTTHNWTDANKALDKIAAYQKFYGAAVYPKASKISVEILYNKLNIFERLWPLYFIIGFVLLVLSFVKILRPSFNLRFFSGVSMGLLILLFIAHSLALMARWYISGHAPWSDGFESMTYIAWATVLAGFIFSRHSPITLASTSILAGLILFVAHLSWMDPAITNLVPVLNSYWLDIHVSMITASYGFIGLGALLGFITLLLFILKNSNNERHISLSILELNAINEMTLMIGLALLTVGMFLGGVWANQSWGHYWGWDPKEVWALVSVLVYAVVIHIRFVKAIYTPFNFSVISLLAFTSVLMTYFGVNYYLGGLHSYAKGDPVPIPGFVPITYSVVFFVIAFASMRDTVFNPKNAKNNFVWTILLAIGGGGIVYETFISGKPMYVLIICIAVELLLLFSMFHTANKVKQVQND